MKKKKKEKDQKVKIHNFPGGTSEIILKEIDELVADKPYCRIIQMGTNAIINGINSLNSGKKIVKINKLPETQLQLFVV